MKFSSPEGQKTPNTPPHNPFVVAEQIKQSPEEVERIAKKTEALFDALLQEFIENHARKVNEGNNGVIFKVDFRGASDLVRKRLEQNGFPIEDEQAVKILKFGQTEDARNEFEMQERFYECLREARDKSKPMAKIPRPVACRSITVDGPLREKLMAEGIKFPGDKIDVMVMDLIKGEDMATIMYRSVIEHHPRTVHLRNQVQHLTFSELAFEVEQALGFTKAGGKGRTENERLQEQAKVDADNRKKVYAELRRTGFKLHPSIEPQMRNALEQIHRHGLIHRDAHHRNFMIEGETGPDAKQPPQVYIIDFGGAKTFEGEYSERLFSESAGDDVELKFVEDFMVPNDIRTNFMQTEAERRAQEFEKEKKDIVLLFERLKKNPAKKQWTMSLDAPGKEVNFALLFSQTPTPKVQAFIGLLDQALQKGILQPSMVKKVLTEQSKSLSLPEQALITRYLWTIE